MGAGKGDAVTCIVVQKSEGHSGYGFRHHNRQEKQAGDLPPQPSGSGCGGVDGGGGEGTSIFASLPSQYLKQQVMNISEEIICNLYERQTLPSSHSS